MNNCFNNNMTIKSFNFDLNSFHVALRRASRAICCISLSSLRTDPMVGIGDSMVYQMEFVLEA